MYVICTMCGKRVESKWGKPMRTPGWFELKRDTEQPEESGDDFYIPEDLGDFCSAVCLLRFVQVRLYKEES